MMKQILGNKSTDAFYLDEECSNEASSSLDTDEDDLEEQDYMNNENELELTKANASKQNAARKRKTNKKIDYSKKRKCRTTFNKHQLNILESEFIQSNFVSNEKIDYLVQSTGLDSRIIKNWFKNKRSRVLADTKTNSVSTLKQTPMPKTAKAELPSEEVKTPKAVLCTANSENSSNKSLNGLFNMVQSINTSDARTKCAEKPKELKPKMDPNCLKCCRSSKEFCNCGISNQALKKLYKYCGGFNTSDFIYCYDEKYSFSHEYNNNDENGKIFFSL